MDTRQKWASRIAVAIGVVIALFLGYRWISAYGISAILVFGIIIVFGIVFAISYVVIMPFVILADAFFDRNLPTSASQTSAETKVRTKVKTLDANQFLKLMEKEQYSEALLEIDEIFKSNDQELNHYAIRGELFFKLGYHFDAVEDFTSYLKQSSKLAPYFHGIYGAAMMNIGEYEKAKYHVQIAVDAKEPGFDNFIHLIDMQQKLADIEGVAEFNQEKVSRTPRWKRD